MFSGEMLNCDKCGFKQKSHPHIESGWYKLVIDDRPKDICPRCLGDNRCPQCPTCQKFYHEDYLECPWCKKSA